MCCIVVDLGCSAPSVRVHTQHRPLLSANIPCCDGVHHKVNPLSIMAVRRGNVTKSLCATATLADYRGASSAPSGGVHHTRKRHNSIHVPYRPAERRHYSKVQMLQKALASTRSRRRLWIFFPIV